MVARTRVAAPRVTSCHLRSIAFGAVVSRQASELPGTVNCIAQQNLSPDELQQYVTAEGMLNEFQMMWSLRKRFPLHYIVFKQIASHLPHEANVEQYFSRAGNVSDPNMDPVMSRAVHTTHSHESGRVFQLNSTHANHEQACTEGKGLVINNLPELVQ